jgi:glyoxylase-like metal-dependent hydrolase (beta-lactamase superfamily II)
MFAATGKGVVVFDAPQTMAGKLLGAIASVTKEPVTHLVYSHSHLDHIGGASEFGPSVKIIASTGTAAMLRRFNDKRRPQPSISFASGYDLKVGTLRAKLTVANSGHDDGSLYIFLPDKRILMTVDIVYPGWVPFTNLGMSHDVGLFVKSHDDLLAYNFDIFVGGHLGRAGTRKDVEVAREYVHDLIAATEQARASVDFMAIARQTGTENKWLMAKAYMDAVADTCAKTMIAKWSARLGATDVSTPGHCWVMQEFMNINGSPRPK